MPQAGFNILLVSNVSADVFPDNTPSQFSTILADDIALPGGDWEAAVTNIMYPSQIASTTEEDTIEIFTYKDKYRALLPVPARGEHESFSNRLTVRLSIPTKTPAKTPAETRAKPPAETPVETPEKPSEKTPTKPIAVQPTSDATQTFAMSEDTKLVDYINSAFKTYNVAHLIHLKEKKYKVADLSHPKKKTGTEAIKYILDVYKEDVAIILHPDLREYLGFRDDKPLLKGTHWAWTPFDSKALPPPKEKQLIIVTDLRTQVKEHCLFRRSFDDVLKPTQVFYTAELPLKFKDGKDDDLYWEPTLTLSINPLKGKISLMKSQHIPANIANFERSITFIRFDPKTRTTFNLEPIYIANFTQSSSFTIDFTPVSLDTAKTLVDSEVDVFFEGIRELDSSMEDRPITTVKLDSDTPIKDPSAYVAPLNAKATAHKYNFTYDNQRQRFTVKTGKETFLRLSPTLAAILGFSNLADRVILPDGVISAAECPVIDRAITSLYCYSNIVDSVYVGNVKAPLLLACPFRKDPNSNVTQLEFLNPTYRKLNRNNLHQLDVGIYDEAGALVPFLYGKTTLNIHFRP